MSIEHDRIQYMKFHNKRVLKHTDVLARDISTDKVLAFYHRCMEISLHKTFFIYYYFQNYFVVKLY